MPASSILTVELLCILEVRLPSSLSTAVAPASIYVFPSTKVIGLSPTIVIVSSAKICEGKKKKRVIKSKNNFFIED